MKKSVFLWLLVYVVLLLIPFIIGDNRYFFYIIVTTMLWIMVAISINIITGTAGLLSIAHGGFFGIGAYTSAVLVTQYGASTYLSFPAAIIITGICSLLVGIPALKLKGAYFAIGTLIYGAIITMIIEKWESLTKGTYGIFAIPPENSIPVPLIGSIGFNSITGQYYLILFFTIIFYFIMSRLVKSPKGLVLLSIREKEDLTESLGINIRKNKLICFILSSVMMGIAGFLYAHFVGYLSPDDSSFFIQFQGLIFCVIGGLGTLLGPIVGSIILNVIPEFLHVFKGYRLIFFGVMLLCFILFMPHGLMGAYYKYAANKKRK